MPIEIKELHIKINVDDKPQSTDNEQAGKNAKDKIIEACVEQVLEIISKNKER